MIFARQYILDDVIKVIDKPLIKVITGLRRSGKSSLLTLIADHLLDCGTSKEQILRINFESLQNSYLLNYQSLYDYVKRNVVNEEPYYLFLDEIQEVDQWEKAINSLIVDFSIDIYITGSNSNLLSSELSTYLAGRYIEFSLQTLSFAEAISFYENTNDEKLDIEQHFERYMKLGGFPVLHIAEYDIETAYKIIYDIYTSTILRDTIQRHNIRNIELLERVIKFALENMGQTFSANRIAGYFKSQNRSVDINTIHNYLHALESSFLLYKVERYDLKGKEILKTQEKYFPGDIGFLYALYGYKSSQVSGVLESLVHAELKRRGYTVHIGKLYTTEIDFVATKREHKIYIQVAYQLVHETTIKRELSPLRKIDDAYPKYLISTEKKTQSSYEGVRHMHIGDFLLASDY